MKEQKLLPCAKRVVLGKYGQAQFKMKAPFRSNQ